MKYKILWIEDGAFVEVENLAGPVLITGEYDIDVALNASDAIKKIKCLREGYDAVIVDIRIPPGLDTEWEKLSETLRRNKKGDRLGIQLLFSLLKPEEAEIKIKDIPAWISPDKFAILSVEGEREVKAELVPLGVDLFRQKETRMANTALLDLIKEVLSRPPKQKTT